MILTRRSLLRHAIVSVAAAELLPFAALNLTRRKGVMRSINIVNFIRAVEPRGPMDLLLPVQKQMESVLREKLPATWLLQYDAMVLGTYVEFLKENMASDHEVGLWFEMNEEHCKAAGVQWRGRPGHEWDWSPPVAFGIGYTIDERIKLVDEAARKFHELWGRFPKSVASWNLDAISVRRFTESYGVDAFAVCRDQIATDGFTIWGAPIAGYFPSKTNCWSPALHPKSQIGSPIFRMLGQDPVYYYERKYRLPDGEWTSDPDTMEPVWPSGQSQEFVDEFLDMIVKKPCGEFAYAQLGQENSFGWQTMAQGFELQMKVLARMRGSGAVRIETLGETGRRFKRAFSATPAQAQVQLSDPFGHSDPAERTVWYQTRFYRANLHFKGGTPFFRDLTVYNDSFPQPFLDEPTQSTNVEQRMPAILDGYHWRKSDQSPGAGWLRVAGRDVTLSGDPQVLESDSSMSVEMPLTSGGRLTVRFQEREISIESGGGGEFSLEFEWDPEKAAFRSVGDGLAEYEWQGFFYRIRVLRGTAAKSGTGWTVRSERREIRLSMP